MTDSATAGFKYFVCSGIKKIKIKVRGYSNGVFEVRTKLNGEKLGVILIGYSSEWKEYTGYMSVPDGVNALYFTYRGFGSAAFASFTLE